MSRAIISIAEKVIPKSHWHVASKYKRYLLALLCLSFCGSRFNCPICGGYFRRLLSAGVKLRSNAQCPRCGSLERHRLLWLYLRDRTVFFTENLTVLDVAPMECLQRNFKAMPNLHYNSVDLESPLAMTKMDITNMQFSDDHFDCIICYHVLEHIPDDRRAMKEMCRVLRPTGWAILQVPILGEKTFENPSIVTPEEREKVFGQRDHVRAYGLDYKERLEEAGFKVIVDNYIAEMSTDALKRHRLQKDESIYLCSKPR